MKMKLLILFAIFTLTTSGTAQEESPLHVVTKHEKGIEVVQKDSLFGIRFQFRMQNRAGYLSTSQSDLSAESFEFRIRRLRMAVRGFVHSSKITYYFQISFSRGDLDWDSSSPSLYNTSPNIIRDAIIFYEPIPNLKLGFGQTKLPGNRQRVVSSGNLQFTDRSIVNATFTLDRDFGFFATYESDYYRLKGAITSGEGRNSVQSDGGLNYTGRLEILPFGKFTGENEDWEGDLIREKKPKLAIGANYNYNSRAVRQGGTLAGDLYSPVDLQNIQADLLFKYQGFAFMQEYCYRSSDLPVTVNASDPTKTRAVYNGFGSNTQVSYLFKNNYELAGRCAFVVPDRSVYDNSVFEGVNEKRQEQYILGITKYLYGHRLKVQGNLLYQVRKDLKNETQKVNMGPFFKLNSEFRNYVHG
ncbi:MAG: porin [Saprospiraceae bacterium]|nr:porin [Saprospiraceae bacterium]